MIETVEILENRLVDLFGLIKSFCKQRKNILQKLITFQDSTDTQNWTKLIQKLKDEEKWFQKLNQQNKKFISLFHPEHSEDEDNQSSLPPLHLSIHNGYNDAVKILLSSKADIELQHENEGTALHVACKTGNIEIVKLLLRDKANIEAKDKDEYTPLHIACQYGQTEAVSLLISSKAKIEEKETYQMTPLHIASRYGNAQIVKQLLSAKANTEAKQEDQYTPLHFASMKGYEVIVSYLVSARANIESLQKTNCTPLHLACQNGDHKVVSKLIMSKANIEAKQKSQSTPLHFAARYGFAEVVQLLLKSKAHVDVQQETGLTPLHIACSYGHTAAAETLITYNANIEAHQHDHETPLHLSLPDVSVMSMMLSHKADLNLKIENILVKHYQPAQELISSEHYEKFSLLTKLKLVRILSASNNLSDHHKEKVVQLFQTKQQPEGVRILMDTVVYSLQHGFRLILDWLDVQKFLQNVEKEHGHVGFIQDWLPWFKLQLFGDKFAPEVPIHLDLTNSLHADVTPNGLQCKAQLNTVMMTITANKFVSSGKWYFEIELLSTGLLQIGFATKQFQPPSEISFLNF
eukprot:TRINITY_DN14765_c0_g1_i1.p1 TRINITY_DN14765_c0_g1~~TRINITY_DN14765_c0_g1_i1.p1  ORF type:complete len:586 (-),score=149.20 TRINITY_DN14765_c0_g1_i1:373-2103(-)